jgi:hypothetical protein
MQPNFIGYFPKSKTARPDWLQTPRVEEICSVSQCIAKGPEGWIDQWKHNSDTGVWMFDSPQLATSVIPPLVRDNFQIYAYAHYPVLFQKGQQEAVNLLNSSAQPLTNEFEELGFDVVSRSLGNSVNFECSPLSCNHIAAEIETNRYCLLESLDRALEVAHRFSIEEPEPGPFHIVQVWRLRPTSLKDLALNLR